MIKTAFILGAGLGTRLRPLTENCPKPLLCVRNKPIICHAMDRLIEVGVERFIVNTRHCAEVYDEKFPDKKYRGREIALSHEPILLDTGGGLKNIEHMLGGGDDNLLVYNGDILANLDLSRLVAHHEDAVARGNCLATLLLRTNPSGNVNFDDDNECIADMRDRLRRAGTRRCGFTGIYCVSRKFFTEIPSGKIESVVEAFLRCIARGNNEIRGIVDDGGEWRDLGTPADFHAAELG
ncbi:MAG: nucleotidyltransferase family protein [Opitutae bacterium]|nr:nucleotidyltransferase family protein [Opitutae bacterium]